jgi:glycosyltransferase involved in cell wall biosynthesis
MRHSRHWWQAIGHNLRTIRAVRKAILAAEPDVVLSFCDKTNIVVLAAMRGRGVPIVISEHTDPRYHTIGPVWQRLRRLLYPLAAASIVLSETIAPTVAQWTKSPPAIIPPAIDWERFASGIAPVPGTDRDRQRRVATLGRLSPEKGTDRAITAFALVAKQYPEWTFVVGGDGPLRGQLESQGAALSLRHQVHFAGWIADPVHFLRQTAIFVLPSHYEGFPVALLEAMAAGCACVAFDCPSGPRQIITDSESGCLVPADDIDALGKAIAELIAAPEKRTAMGARGQKVAMQYDWDSFVAAHCRVLQQVVAVG